MACKSSPCNSPTDNSLTNTGCSPQIIQPPINNYTRPPTPHGPPTGPSSNVGYRTNITYLEVPRIFYPSTLCIPRPPTPQSLTTYNNLTNLTHPLFNAQDAPSPNPHIDCQTIVVSFSVLQTSSLGIFFGPNSKHNFSLLFDNTLPYGTSMFAAEIFAAQKTLKLARGIANVFGPDRIAAMKIIVVTTCAPVVRAMTQWLDKDWDSASKYFGGTAENKGALDRLDRLIEEIVDEDGLEVEFWLVGREGVAGAHELARSRLGRSEAFI